MKLKLSVAMLTILLTTSGCIVHFPLSDNVPSLQSSNDTTPTSEMGQTPTAPNTQDPVKGNSADTPDHAQAPSH